MTKRVASANTDLLQVNQSANTDLLQVNLHQLNNQHESEYNGERN